LLRDVAVGLPIRSSGPQDAHEPAGAEGEPIGVHTFGDVSTLTGADLSTLVTVPRLLRDDPPPRGQQLPSGLGGD
jgi:hypothetical protein